MKKILGLAPNVFLLGLVSLFNDFSSEMIYAVMPAFLVGVLQAPPLFLGLLEGFADALASLLKIFSGWFSDKIGKRKVLAVSGYALSTSTRFFLSRVTGFWQVFLLRAIDRIGKGFRDSPRDALLTESVQKAEIGKSFGYHRTMDTIGGILGPLAAVVILPLIAYDYRALFLIGFGAGLLALLTFLFVKDVRLNRETSPKKLSPFTFSMNGFKKPFKMFVASIFIFGMGVMPITLMLLKANDLGFGGGAIPLMYLVYSVAFVLFAIPLGKVSDKLGEKLVMNWGFIAAMFSYIVFASTHGAFGVIIGFIAFGLYGAMTDGVGRALVSKLVQPESLATGQGFLQAAVGLSSLLAGVIGGLIWTFGGSGAAFAYGAVLMAIGLLMFNALNGARSAV